MRLNATNRYTIDAFPAEIRSWITKLTDPLNNFKEQVIQAINQGLTLRDNFKAQVFNVAVSASQVYPIKQAYTLNEKPTSVVIGSLRESTGATPTAAYCVYWQYINNNIEVTFIGLDATKSYTISLVVQV